jgi:hypothetical protein
VRGGRNIERRGVRTGEEGAIPIPVVTLWAESRTGAAAGSPWKRQHEHMPLHSSCVMGTGCPVVACCEEEPAKYSSSHQSQCGECIAMEANSAHKSHATAHDLVWAWRTTLR